MIKEPGGNCDNFSEFWKVDFCPFFGKITRSVHTFLN